MATTGAPTVYPYSYKYTPTMESPYNSTTAAYHSQRSVTPATNNTRAMNGRYSSAPRDRVGNLPHHTTPSHNPTRAMTPDRYMGAAYNSNAAAEEVPLRRAPAANGLIRLSLKKPMGIVFEPMYDPQQPSHQRGVRICDLPRTGAAALSHQLEIGDELLSINDRTVSRLNFDEIMDFIIEADPECVHLLFRRPRKTATVSPRALSAPRKIENPPAENTASKIKWEEPERTISEKKKRPKKGTKKLRKTKKKASREDETTGTLTEGDESYVQPKSSRRSGNRGSKASNPYESESFLDTLIDTICSNSNNICRDTFRRVGSFSDYEDSLENETLTSERDESSYVTYEDDSTVDPQTRKKGSASKPNMKKDEKHDNAHVPVSKVTDHPEQLVLPDTAISKTMSISTPKQPSPPAIPTTALGPINTTAKTPAAPVQEVEYDDEFDHGAEVSVMESLGGPSLLLEKQRIAMKTQAAITNHTVPEDIISQFGQGYPAHPGMSTAETIQADPLQFYSYVVESLLEQYEPEKVRLLDKLLAKYTGREDHLVQKLSVRYQTQNGTSNDQAFNDAVQKTKSSLAADVAITAAKYRMEEQGSWPEKEEKVDDMPVLSSRFSEKEDEDEDDDHRAMEDEDDESGSEYSNDVDGTSPAVIAQVSELLNYVYGKTSVPGQIDRVSTIMRAYEGREAVLLELLETKALIKAKKEKEKSGPLPSFLRHSQTTNNVANVYGHTLPPVTPMATNEALEANGSAALLQDDISSMSGISSPADEHGIGPTAPRTNDHQLDFSSTNRQTETTAMPAAVIPKKKKGLFGGLFKKKSTITTPNRAVRHKNHRTVKGVTSLEGSI
ncbi:predicted protein [Phaeodactylum tricornutum CCAP 1055/1]|uniref:PDZ domain-containing protein n=1 Tax=Phaeodactylum tricornutum (strain CCAP 1055/1) TaxID=556484 RepID=B7FW06_PHATC|nr:predicted protein [Phaeodactylum tricornutum CCAP 1055/1]EEC49718.1 predicted protein [Phaeodactylum tricornutum CCAP 1055/1]|eukprot:XP_002179020.1 predicted protein [Phaeodactylum tricornutum CCAP 1055/1]